MNINSLSLLDKTVQVTPQVIRMLGGLLEREVTRDDPEWAAAMASLTVGEKVKIMPSRRQHKKNEMYNFDLNELMDLAYGGVCKTGDRCGLSSADGMRLRSGGLRGQEDLEVVMLLVALTKNLGHDNLWGPPHGNLFDGSIWTTRSNRPTKHEGNKVEKLGSLRK